MNFFGFGNFSLGGLFPIIMIAVLIGVVFVFAGAIREQLRNRKAPVLTVDAFVASKRISVSTEQRPSASGDGMMFTSSSETCYVTFQVESGDRMEFSVSRDEYQSLMEGESGRLTFQGTRYMSFLKGIRGAVLR